MSAAVLRTASFPGRVNGGSTTTPSVPGSILHNRYFSPPPPHTHPLIPRRIDPTNWVEGVIPRKGAVVSFPKAVSEFNDNKGAGFHIKGDWKLSELAFPFNGKFEIALDIAIDFMQPTPDAPQARWRQKAVDEEDFKCAANWRMADGTVATAAPCYQDTVVFPKGHALQVYTEAHTYVEEVLVSRPLAS